ncbi:MAG TPA: bifunctional 5,10-methylenetetrahydrofolate dehydrogenase/5,10-methenyltetrahydrofolate cyclohydrolase [Patescibacteria group bacterium]|nr:bifunctional 5,10-methylenetetrahydrofolate dehydrogenase/5,10-methenyltetrahydrofolate cyclohydrolase [Patescibacteria group bacterium]
MHLIDGKSLAERIRAELKKDITEAHLSPRLAILLVGHDPASELYVNLKKKAADEIGVRVDVHHLASTTSDEELMNLIETWNADPDIHGILVQVPLPPGHDENRVLAAINPKKDADGFHEENTKALFFGEPKLIPPVHEGVLRLINETPLKLSGAQGVIIANSELFASPLRRLLETAGVSVLVMHPDELDRDRVREADLIVIAIGRLKFLHAFMTKDDAVVIDIGTNKTEEGKVRGDADMQSFEKTNVWITPVPGGVGPMTIAELLKNVVELAKKGTTL